MSDLFTLALNHYFDTPFKDKPSKTAFSVLHNLMRSIEGQTSDNNQLKLFSDYLVAIKESGSEYLGGAKKEEVEQVIENVFKLKDGVIGNLDLVGLNFIKIFYYFAIVERLFYSGKLSKEDFFDDREAWRNFQKRQRIKLIREKEELAKKEAEKREKILSQMLPIEQFCYELGQAGASEQLASDTYKKMVNSNELSEKIILAKALMNYYKVINKWECATSKKQKDKIQKIKSVLEQKI